MPPAMWDLPLRPPRRSTRRQGGILDRGRSESDRRRFGRGRQFHFHARVGTTYSYIITSDGGDGSVIDTGTTTQADQQVTDINVANLPDGLLTFSVTLTDAAGNVGNPAVATATLDQSVAATDSVFEQGDDWI